MAIALVQTGTALNVSGGTSGTITLTGVTAGNLLTVVVCDVDANSVTFTVTDDKSNTWARSVGNSGAGGGRAEIWHCLSAASGTTVITVTSDATTIFVAQAQEWSGGTFSVDTSSSIDEAATTSHVCSADATVIDTSTAALVICCSGRDGTTSFGTQTAGTGYTAFNGVGTDFDRAHWQYQLFPSATSNERGSFTTANSRSAVGCIAAWKVGCSEVPCWWPCCTDPCASTGGAYNTFCGNTPTVIADTDQYEIDAWTSRTDATPARNNQATASYGGAAYTFGGYNSSSPFKLADNDEYVTDIWTAKTDMPSPYRVDHNGLTINAKLYSVYGEDFDLSSYVKDTDEYDVSGNSWTNKTDGPNPARKYLAVAGIGSYGYAWCGNDSAATNLRDNDQFDQSGNSWASKTDSPTPARTGLGGFDISSKGYVSGGTSGTWLRDVDEYDPAGDAWTSKGDMPTPGRTYYGNESLSSAVAGYISGGSDSVGARTQQHDEYTPDSWTSRSNIPSPARHYNSSGFA